MQYPILKMADDNDLSGRSFVGVAEGAEGFDISVPYGINLPDIVDSSDLNNMRFLKIYVKAIQKALNSQLVKNNVERVTNGINHPLAAVNIIYDYISQGALIKLEKEERLSTMGNIDFNRTIKLVEPCYIQGNLIYDTFVTKKNRVVDNNFVAIAQGNVINHFMEHGGEILFGSKLRVPVSPIKFNKSIITKLKRALTQTFNSREQNVIRWMLEYLSDVSINNVKKGNWSYAIIASTLWEAMVDATFGNQKVRNKSLYGKKYAFYSLTNKVNSCYGRPTEHDTIYEDDNEVIIIDAKMYATANNLLSEDVLGKQFGYYIEAKKRKPQKRIINILFLPLRLENSDKNGFSDEVILDPHCPTEVDPERIIYIYKYPANDLVRDYYYSKKRLNKVHEDFETFIQTKNVRKFLDSRKTGY